MNPHVDEDLCIGDGDCEEVCPKMFRVEDDGFAHVINAQPDPELYECIREAADSCPTGAITINE